jgi:DNA-binding response OmpR family regulator
VDWVWAPRGVPDMMKVMVTGFPDLWNAIDSVNEGADAYVTKPFEVSELLATIQRLLKRQAARRRYTQSEVTEYIESRTEELVDDRVALPGKDGRRQLGQNSFSTSQR